MPTGTLEIAVLRIYIEPGCCDAFERIVFSSYIKIHHHVFELHPITFSLQSRHLAPEPRLNLHPHTRFLSPGPSFAQSLTSRPKAGIFSLRYQKKFITFNWLPRHDSASLVSLQLISPDGNYHASAKKASVVQDVTDHCLWSRRGVCA